MPPRTKTAALTLIDKQNIAHPPQSIAHPCTCLLHYTLHFAILAVYLFSTCLCIYLHHLGAVNKKNAGYYEPLRNKIKPRGKIKKPSKPTPGFQKNSKKFKCASGISKSLNRRATPSSGSSQGGTGRLQDCRKIWRS